MANEEHLKILKQGVEWWNRWREVSDVIRPDLSEADLYRADLIKAKLYGANLTSADLSEADLYRANLTSADLSKAYLHRANFNEANLGGANLSGANLSKAYLNRANLSKAHLSKAYLSRADFREADLSGTAFNQADLSEANLTKADLSGADLSGADLSGAQVGGTTFGAVDLSVAKGLDTVVHRGPSEIGIHTLYLSGGKIPEVFLRGCGVPDSFIAYVASLTGQAIQFYSCFISYSHKDEAFATRLHNDLQAKGVRCWFAPEDMKIGDKIRPRIDESIRIHDKLLLVLSEHSVTSQWVEQEVETALEREREQEGVVLFPVRLDNTVMEMKGGWPGLIKNTRHIGNFCEWKEHDAYQKGFDRLLRDLKAEG